jgi:hypothetical protein
MPESGSESQGDVNLKTSLFTSRPTRAQVDPRLGLDRSKLRRMMESAWSQLGRIGLTKNASMIGKLLALGAQRCKLKALGEDVLEIGKAVDETKHQWGYRISVAIGYQWDIYHYLSMWLGM